MSTALLERAFAQAALLPEDKQNSIANLVLELAAATPTEADNRRAGLMSLVVAGALAVGFRFSRWETRRNCAR